MKRRLGLISFSLCLLASTTVRANSAAPDAFNANAEGNTVSIDHYRQKNLCEKEVTLLRKNVETGEVVSLGSGSCVNLKVVDECVPAGKYQYGFVSLPTSCDSQIFTEVTVSAALGDCTRTTGIAAAQAYSGSAPWASEQWTEDCATGCSASGVAAPANLMLLALFALAALASRSRA